MAQSFAPRDTYSKLELSISCTNLKDLDHFSKSDPCVFLQHQVGREWVRLGRTEVIDNNLSPKFSTTFVVEYHFEDIQNLQFCVYDVDDKRRVDDVSKHDFIGSLECTLADIVSAGQEYTRTIRAQGKPRGKITIQSEEVQDAKMLVHMQLSASKLDKKDLFGKSDPFLEIAKAQEGGSFSVVYRSQPIMKTLNPRWPSFEVTAQKLCSGDLERTLKLTVWDWNRSGDHDFIGSCTTILRDICPERGGQVFSLELINPEKKRKRKYTNSGIISLNSVKTTQLHSFADYIKGGCQISLMVAVDFTASNGKPHLPSSLHYNTPYQENEYVQAIRSVASVLAPYDSDQMIPTFGFGARLPPNGEVSHCFPLNFNWQNPQVYGVQARETLAEIPGQLLSYMKTNNIKPNPPPLRKQQSSMNMGSAPVYQQEGRPPYPPGPGSGTAPPYPTGGGGGPPGQAPPPPGAAQATPNAPPYPI